MAKSQRPLNSGQLRWAEEFLVDGDGKAAAMRAGWRSKAAQGVATRYLANTAVMDYVALCQRALRAPPNLTREFVTQGLHEACEMPHRLRNPAGMQAAAREIAQINGFDQPDVIHICNSPQDIPQHKMKYLSDTELLEIIGDGGTGDPETKNITS
jgi:hypothetical protein